MRNVIIGLLASALAGSCFAQQQQWQTQGSSGKYTTQVQTSNSAGTTQATGYGKTAAESQYNANAQANQAYKAATTPGVKAGSSTGHGSAASPQ